MFRIVGIILALFALGGVIAMMSGEVAVDAVSLLLVALSLGGAYLCFRRKGKKKKAQRAAARKKTEAASSPYTFVSFKVAGTSFETDGVSRQGELHKIKNNLPPYGREADVGLKTYTYEGEPAIGCYVNDFQIGNVPKDMIKQVRHALKQRGAVVSAFEVVGGGMRGGEKMHYGARIVIRYNNKN